MRKGDFFLMWYTTKAVWSCSYTCNFELLSQSKLLSSLPATCDRFLHLFYFLMSPIIGDIYIRPLPAMVLPWSLRLSPFLLMALLSVSPMSYLLSFGFFLSFTHMILVGARGERDGGFPVYLLSVFPLLFSTCVLSSCHSLLSGSKMIASPNLKLLSCFCFVSLIFLNLVCRMAMRKYRLTPLAMLILPTR